MGFVGDWIIFSFKILISALLSGSLGWQLPKADKNMDIRFFILSGTFSTMLVTASRHSVKGSQEFMLGFVISGILIAIAIMSSKLITAEKDGNGVLTGVKLLFASSLGILVGAGMIVEAIIAAVVGYIILNHLKLGNGSSNSE